MQNAHACDEYLIPRLVLAESRAGVESFLLLGKRIWEPKGDVHGGANLGGAPSGERGLCHIYTCVLSALKRCSQGRAHSPKGTAALEGSLLFPFKAQADPSGVQKF
jgi:hypothetical protein